MKCFCFHEAFLFLLLVFHPFFPCCCRKDPTSNRMHSWKQTGTLSTVLTSQKPFTRSKHMAAPFFLTTWRRENYYSLKTSYLSITKTSIISFSCFCVITLYYFVINSCLKVSFCATKFLLTVKQSRCLDPTLTSMVQAAELQVDRSAHSRMLPKKSFKQWSVWELLKQGMYLKHDDYL